MIHEPSAAAFGLVTSLSPLARQSALGVRIERPEEPGMGGESLSVLQVDDDVAGAEERQEEIPGIGGHVVADKVFQVCH